MEVRRLTNLARLMATVLAAAALPPKMLKVGRQYRQYTPVHAVHMS
jgi:hypothetical protein